MTIYRKLKRNKIKSRFNPNRSKHNAHRITNYKNSISNVFIQQYICRSQSEVRQNVGGNPSIIIVDSQPDDFTGTDLDIKFFAQLTLETFLQALARLHLSTGKLPESGKLFTRSASADKDSAISDYYCCGNNLHFNQF